MTAIRLALLATLVLAGAACAQAASAQGGAYRLRLGDTVRVAVAGQEALTQEFLIFSGGEISYPGVGRLVWQGRTPAELETEIRAALAKRGMLDAEVSVLLVASAAGKVYIQGAVKNPQEHTLAPFTEVRVSHLVAIAGGLLETADQSRITVHRSDPKAAGGKQIIAINYEQILSGADTAGDLVLAAGDMVVVPARRTGSWAISGEVQRPGEYALSLSASTTVARAILRAGGFTEYANGKRVLVVRESGGTRQTITINANDILKDGDTSKDMPLEPGDLIIVPKGMF